METNDALTHMLRPFTSICKEMQLPYWIDSGTLLGLFRDQSLLSWDDDIDIGMWQPDLKRLYAHRRKLSERGFNMTKQSFDKEIYSITLTSSTHTNTLPIHIHGYYVHDGIAWAPQVVACQPHPVLQQPWALEHPSPTRDFLLWCKRLAKQKFEKNPSVSERILSKTLCLMVWGLFYVIKEPLDRKTWHDRWPFNLIYRIYTWKIPLHYFQSLMEIELGGLLFAIPRQTEAYLTARYGDWKVPNKQWVYWRDDKCLYFETPSSKDIEQGNRHA